MPAKTTVQMLERSVRGRATLGADRAYDTRDFVAAVRARGVTPHVARNKRGRRSAIDGRTTRHAGYGQSLRRRKLVEEVFGWLKTVGGGRKLRYLGRERNRAWLELTAAAYNLVRPSRLEPVGVLGAVRPAAQPPPERAAGGRARADQSPEIPFPGRPTMPSAAARYARDPVSSAAC